MARSSVDARFRLPIQSNLLLPPRSTAGQLTLDQHIGVRIPGGQPKNPNKNHGFSDVSGNRCVRLVSVSVSCPQLRTWDRVRVCPLKDVEIPVVSLLDSGCAFGIVQLAHPALDEVSALP